MFWKYFGTFINALTVIIGSGAGLLLRHRNSRGIKKENMRETLPEAMMGCLGLCTIFAAASGLLGVESGSQAIIVVASMVLGLLIGYGLRIDDHINRMGERLVSKTGDTDTANPAAGFVTACLLFCIGSMTIVGAFEGARNGVDGLELNCHTTLLIKSLLDLVSSACLSVTYGASVMVSAAFVIAFQGGLTLLASYIQPFLTQINALPMVNCVGSLVLLAIAMNLLGVRKTKTADLLPAIFLPILICWILNLFGVQI